VNHVKEFFKKSNGLCHTESEKMGGFPAFLKRLLLQYETCGQGQVAVGCTNQWLRGCPDGLQVQF